MHPDDSVSSGCSRHSQQILVCSGQISGKSGKSSASYRLKAEAEKAALFARAAALQEKHALEEQQEQLRGRKEQLDIDAEIAASIAKLSVYQAASECSSQSEHLWME